MTEIPEATPNFFQESRVIGEIILGEVDPRFLSRAEFNSSQGLLYHGAAKEFVYSPKGHYDIDDTGGDGTHDYGEGFYTTDDPGQAINYSLVRTPNILKQPKIYSFLPFKAKMLDVRCIDDPRKNGILPNDFVERWLSYLGNYILDDRNFADYNEFLKEIWIEGIREDFINRVKTAREQGKEIRIRSEGPNSPGIFRHSGQGLASTIFRKFMLSLGYDGMIYREGGEGQKREDLTGYVFFNPRVLDTWEGWQKRK